MKKGTVIALVIAVVLLIGAGMYAVSKSSDKSSNATKTDTSTSSNANNQDTSAQAANVVAIADMAFSPAKITVKKGTMVTWTNKDSMNHTVTMDAGTTGGPNSGNLANNQSYSFTFNAVGNFPYHCAVHPSMKATVEVTE
jgi:amicyanin